jgi:hypothetical protein
MKEIAIPIEDERYADMLLIALARQGYEVYFGIDNDHVCFLMPESELA